MLLDDELSRALRGAGGDMVRFAMVWLALALLLIVSVDHDQWRSAVVVWFTENLLVH